MTTPLSQDLHQGLVASVENGSSIRQAAVRRSISVSAAAKLVRRVRETGSLKPHRSEAIAIRSWSRVSLFYTNSSMATLT